MVGIRRRAEQGRAATGVRREPGVAQSLNR
jgi:hypothetical protein